MKALSTLLVMLLLVAESTAVADVPDGDERPASVLFWNFAKCIADRDPSEVRKLLATQSWEDDDSYVAGALVQRSVEQHPLRSGPCGYFDTLKFDAAIFHGTLAGAMFIRDANGEELPDYSHVIPPVSSSTLASTTDQNAQMQLGLRAFAFCVFVNRPLAVRDLLKTRPFSQPEQSAFETLGSTFGGCLPAQEGTRLSFSHVRLRALLGDAAYYADSQLSSRTSSGKFR